MSDEGKIIQDVVSETAAVSAYGSATVNVVHNYYYYKEYRGPEHREALIPERGRREEAVICPYRGLAHFGPNDTKFFFGRGAFVQELLEAAQSHDFLAVLGASGSGKSSAVFAGLVPALLAQGEDLWQFTHFRPGRDPFHSLALALASMIYPTNQVWDPIVHARKVTEIANLLQDESRSRSIFFEIQHIYPQKKILLIADQFEELYTLNQDKSLRRKFLDCLLQGIQFSNSHPTFRLVLVATMRASVLGSALSYPPFAEVFRSSHIMLGAMDKSQLADVIKKPAETLGRGFEAGLIARIQTDVETGAGSLPLLEFALFLLWKNSTGNLLTHAAYEEIGEIKGALVKYADDTFASFTPDEQLQTRGIFLQLVRLGEETKYNPRVATKKELKADNWPVVEKLAKARLIIIYRKEFAVAKPNLSTQHIVASCEDNELSQEIVEVTHEALIQHWEQLREWLEESRGNILQKDRIEAAATEWLCDRENRSLLFHGTRLKRAICFRKQQRIDFALSEEAEEFIQEGEKEKKKKAVQVAGVLTTISMLGIGIGTWAAFGEAQPIELSGRLSLGEHIFYSTHVQKRSGSDYVAMGRSDKAAEKFKESLAIKPDDPEALIYFNNAIVADEDALTIVVSAPVLRTPNVAQEMLRGVAQAQDGINKKGGINGKPLRVMISNDDNDPEIAAAIATRLVGDKEILAVVGHNASDVSAKGADVYQDHLVMISPTSFALNLDELKKPKGGNYIFRTVYSYNYLLPNLTSYMETQRTASLLICHDTKSYDQKWFRDGFSQNNKITISDIDCDFSNPELNLEQVISGGVKEGTKALFLAPHVNRINEAIDLVKANGGQLKLFGATTLYTHDTLKLGKEDVEGLVLSVYWHPRAFPRHPFYEEAMKLWGKGDGITWRTAMAYDATQVIIEGLMKIPSSLSPHRKELQKQLSTSEFKIMGATGKVQFLPSGERRGGKAFLLEVCAGKESGAGYDFVPLGACQKI